MSLNREHSRPERRLRRARGPEDRDLELLPASKRSRLPALSATDQYHHKTFALPDVVPMQPKPGSHLKSTLSEINRDTTTTNEQSIHNWLKTISPVLSPRNAPAQVVDEQPDAPTAPNDYRQSFFQILKEIPETPPLDVSQMQGQSLGGPSSAVCRNSRQKTAGFIYRTILHNNGVHIDQTGDSLPNELREFVNKTIFKRRMSKLSPEEVSATVQTAVDMADSGEGEVRELIGTAMFPVIRRDIARGQDVLWSTETLPNSPRYPYSLAAPKPDMHIGYHADTRSTWTGEDNAVVDHPVALPYTRPARSGSSPFLVFELKSEATGGTLWQAENQAAGSGTHCVSSLRWLFREASPSKILSVLDTIAFTVVLTHRTAVLHIHFYSEANALHYMSRIGTFSPLRDGDVQRSNHVIENILEYCLGTRQRQIRKAIGNISTSMLEANHSFCSLSKDSKSSST